MSLLTTRLGQVMEQFRDKTLIIENFSGRSVTAGELKELSGKIAAALQAKGAGKGAIVPIILPRCIDYVAAEIGALRAGCGYAPLLPEYPPDRVDYIKKDCQAPLVIDEAFIREAMGFEPISEDVETNEDHVSLLIYTSGSTGNPKGVVHTHRSFYDSLERDQIVCPTREDDKTLGLVSFSFAWSVAEIYDTLIVGAQLVILNTDERKDLKYVRNAIRENGITVMYINPNMLKRLDMHDSTLRVVKTAGERLADFYTDEYQIINIYGTSETHCILYFTLDHGYDNTPIGKAYYNSRVVLLDENGKEVPPGEEGEICICGHLSKGYLNLPEQTEKVFSKDPFSDDEDSVLYHTSDMGRLLPDGSVLYVNRKDWMVKINGQRVESGEIEVRIVTDHPEVETAVVKAFQNEFGLTYLAAYYQVKKGQSVTAKEIEASLRRKMPDYMIPRFFVEVESFPLNPNGKLDRKAIQPPMAASFKEEYVAPETEYEKILCDAFEKLLKCGQVGINDNFFSLGGDSMLAMGLQAECGIAALSSEMIFSGKTPREIGARLEQAENPEASEKLALTEYPLNPFETGMYLEQKLRPESRMYNMIGYYEADGVSAEQMKTAVEEIFRSHEAFHSVYREKNGTLMRVLVDEMPSVTIQQVEDLKAARETAETLDHDYDLSEGIPVCAVIYTDGKGCLLALVYHHIMFDGGSDVLFGRELFARLTGKSPVIDSFDLSGASQEEKESAYRKGFEKYQELYADGVPVTELPLKASRPKVHPESDTNRFFTVSGDLLKSLKQAARQRSATVFDMLLSAYSMTAAKYTASEDIVISVPVNTRNGNTHNTIGMFVNTALLRLKPVRTKQANDYIQEVKENVSEYVNGNTCPFDRLVAAFAKDRDASRNLLSDLGINYVPLQTAFRENGVTLNTSYRLQPSGKDLNLVMQVKEQGIDCYLQYSGELFDDTVIDNFIDQFLTTAEKLCADQPGTVRQALFLPALQQKTLKGFSTTARADIPVTLLHRLFEQSARDNADKTALIAKDRTLTYRELNEGANIVAHNLIGRNIRTGDSVVLLLPRESSFFCCLFGVNKAGAAFIPCDPQYPADRIRSIIEDSGASCIITTKDKLPEYADCHAIDVDDLLVGNMTDNPDVAVSGDDLAYMIYTSGSTGKPKGVMLRHIGICNYLMPHPANSHIFYLKENISTYLSVTTVSFDMSFKEHTAALCNGKTLVFASEDEMNDPRALAELMQKYHVDCMNATPSRLQQYMEYEPFRKALAGCKLVMSGGEGYPISLRDAISSCSSDIKIVNTYGPTEITVSCNAADLTKADYVTIGRPLLNYSEYIVDKFGGLAPFGVIGELYVGGPGVALGYRNLPEKTAESFVDYHGERMYRTGDYAKFDRNGNVFILGRLDSQVKLRGLRIELSEIEELIEAQPHIKKAAVVIRKLGGQDNLCAYFTADTTIDIDALRDELKKHLTHYMVPTAYLQMEEMPVTANGKTDTKRLPELTAAAQSATPPQNETQQRIFEIASEVLGNRDFGIETDLYAAGLTSLNSVGFCIRLSDAFGVNVQIRDLRDNDTIEKLERFILAMASDSPEAFEKFDEYAITQTQEGIFFETTSHPDSTIYNIPTLLKLEDTVDLPKLKTAIEAAVNAHPYLMTRIFINKAGEIRQARTDRCFEESEINEIRTATIDDITDSLVRPFDLETDALYRFSIIVTDSGHYLFFDIHHIVFDGESKKILLRDITDAYQGKALTPETYSGYEAALAEQKLRAGAHYDASRKYYTELLDGVESDCLPIDDILSDTRKRDSGILEQTGKETIPSLIKDYCARNGVSENAFCTAVFGWLLAKYCSREEDAVFTTVNNGRNDPRFRNSVSMFVRTYPVLCKTETVSVADYIRQVGKQLADSLQYDVYSFAEISHDLGINADVMFVYQSTMTDGMIFDFCGGKAENVPLIFDEEKAKLEMIIYPDGDRLRYHVSYDADSYTEGFIQDLLTAYERAMTEFARKEEISQVQLVDQETEASLEAVNRFVHEYEPTDIVTMFRRQVEKTPDNIAVVYLDRTYTYREVDRLTENVAAFLKDKGIGRNQAVSVLIPRCEYMPIAALGVLKSGAGYEPLDPTYPPERLEFMIRDADAKYLIADRDLMDRVPNYDGPVLYTDEIPALPDAEKLSENPAPEDLFIMLYTSGSTGVPKGVMLEHHNLCAFCDMYIREQGFDENSRASAYASYGFDAHMIDMYPVLLSGGQLHIIDEAIRLDLIAIRDYFKQNKITHGFMTTQVGRQFADLFPDAEYPHVLIVGGEKLVPLAPPRFRLINGYGPTECTICTHIYQVDQLYRRVPLGTPNCNMKQYVVDKNLNRLPFGIPGELIVAGHQVGRGYLNRPEKNAEVFIPNPFSDEPGYEHAYRTGDIVRILRGGVMDFIGRNDGQVKVRGFRIELSEVEGIIRQFPGIKDATVQAFDETGGGKFVAAYVVSDEPIDVNALAEFIKRDKPAYMVPAVTMQIDRIPLNQNQKVNKRALPKPEKKAEDIVPPQNEVQKTVFDCIANVIGTTAFGITTDIFEAGLTSIGAIKLNVMLSSAFDTPVTIKDLREHNTVQALEEFFAHSEGTETFDLQPDYPITQTQNGIFVECVAHPDATLYNIPFLFRLSDTVDPVRLKEAAEAMINAHPYLKTELFLNDSGDIRARRNDTAAPAVELIDADTLPDQLVQPFALMESRLYRVKIFRTKEGNYLYLDFHHIICDGTSEAVMIEDINAAYGGAVLTTETYTGFEAALAEEKARQSDAYGKAKAYYDKLFDGTDSDFLPSRDVNGQEPSSNRFKIPSALDLAAVKDWCEKNGVTLNAFFNAVFAFVLAKYNYKTEAVYTTIYNGRNDSRLARAVTMLVKTFPVYCALGGDVRIADLIKATGEQLIGSMENDIYSFAEISRAYDIPADVMFAYQGDGFAFTEIGGARAEMVPLTLSEAKAPLNINVALRKGKVFFSCDYRSDRYSEVFMRGFVACMEKTAEQFVTKNLLKEVSVLTKGAGKLVDSFNATEVRIPDTTCNKLFEEQAAKHPDKIAVIADNETLTYTQLNENANRVAHSLIDSGVQVDEMVGVMMPRTVWAYAAREGILKAGAAFMPLAPDYPDDRVSYILENSGAKHVVTTAALAEERKLLFEKAGVTAHSMEDLLNTDKTDNPETGVKPNNLCYCIYTSGSTGKPKGVMIEHHSLVNFVHHDPINVQSCEFVDNMTVSLALAALTFDVSVLEESLGLYHGGTVAMATEEEINNPVLLAEMMKKYGVDVMKCTPSYMNNMLDVPQVAKVLCQMKAIDIGAEAFPAPLYDKMRRAGITAKIHNGYGPTEATITTSIDYLTSNRITIGKPLCNTKVVMLDQYDHELPADVPGELTILGECVGRGYVANEKLNSEKFITFKGLPAYRSGDLARWGKDGKIYFMGRMDNQVKLRGLRIELDEIENVMNSYPSVTRSVVIVKESEQTGQYLCAYFAAGVKVSTDDLAAHMGKSLAKYMIPSVFVQLDAIPLTANGKVDKKALPEPVVQVEERDYVPPKTELQRKLCSIFAYALGTDKVSVTDNFFEIGGTSLTASKIAMKAMMEKLPIVFKDVFDFPTVEAMEKHINGKMQTTTEAKEEMKITESNALSHNKPAFITDETLEQTVDTGNILLTGATGFLGIHVLKCLLDTTDKTVYCLLRANSDTADRRLMNMLMYYFDDPMKELFGSRIQVIKGDITDRDLILTLGSYDFGTVINCAACVKHFVQDDTLDRINWHGVENLIDLCLKAKRRLVQVSTVSVAGTGTVEQFGVDKKIYESELYFGQNLDNKYANTKFKAEQVLLKAVEDDGLDGMVVRVGNLMSRYSDGEFQINFITNNFMRSMRAYAKLGMIPVAALDKQVEFSPIDCTAKAVVTLSATDRQYTVFHATNGHRVQMGDVVEAMNRIGVPVRIVSSKEFQQAFNAAIADEKMNEILSPLISYRSGEGEAVQYFVGHDNSFTTKMLYHLGFKWPIINEDYLTNAFETLEGFGFFTGE